MHPVGYVHDRAGFIARQTAAGGRIRPTDALSREQEHEVVSLDALSPTNDPYSAILPDTSRTLWESEICTRADLEEVCRKNRMPAEAQAFALSRYRGIPRKSVAEFMLINPARVEAARKRFDRALPEIQQGLQSYHQSSRPKFRNKQK